MDGLDRTKHLLTKQTNSKLGSDSSKKNTGIAHEKMLSITVIREMQIKIMI